MCGNLEPAALVFARSVMCSLFYMSCRRMKHRWVSDRICMAAGIGGSRLNPYQTHTGTCQLHLRTHTGVLACLLSLALGGTPTLPRRLLIDQWLHSGKLVYYRIAPSLLRFRSRHRFFLCTSDDFHMRTRCLPCMIPLRSAQESTRQSVYVNSRTTLRRSALMRSSLDRRSANPCTYLCFWHVPCWLIVPGLSSRVEQ